MSTTAFEGWIGSILWGAGFFLIACLMTAILDYPEDVAKAEARCELSAIQTAHVNGVIASVPQAYQVVLCMREESYVLDDTNPTRECGVGSFVARSTSPSCYVPAGWDKRQTYYLERKYLPKLTENVY